MPDPLRITGVETRTYRIALDPPFRAAWDPVPRTQVEATLVAVVHRRGHHRATRRAATAFPTGPLLERLLVGVDPRQGEVVREICETTDFHGGRPWVVEVACWDIAGKAAGEPLWRLLGGRADRIRAYASGGELAGPDERAARAVALADAGVRATKIRFHHADWRDDVAVIAQVREAVGDRLELMVDANQGWRMPGDRAPRWDVATAARVANELSRPWASTGSRSRCAARTTTATPRSAAAPTCASPPARWCARWPRPATSWCAAASTCCRPTSC